MESPNYDSLCTSISIVLGVLTYFLTLAYESGSKLIAKEKPDGEVALKAFRRHIRKALFLGGMPVLLGFSGLFYICFPTVVSVWMTSYFELWDFDLAKTLLVCLELGIAVCLILAAVSVTRLIAKLHRTY